MDAPDAIPEILPREEPVEILQLTLQEDRYCQLRAEGLSRRSAWKEAYGTEGVLPATLDTRVSRLEKRPEILARIDEIRLAVREREAEKWAKRKEELLEVLYHGALRAARDPDEGGINAAVKAVGALATLLGWNEPQRFEVAATTAGTVDAKTVEAKVGKLLELTNGGTEPS